jgi:hypothetical protein
MATALAMRKLLLVLAPLFALILQLALSAVWTQLLTSGGVTAHAQLLTKQLLLLRQLLLVMAVTLLRLT